jgi:hypothetical protein
VTITGPRALADFGDDDTKLAAGALPGELVKEKRINGIPITSPSHTESAQDRGTPPLEPEG